MPSTLQDILEATRTVHDHKFISKTNLQRIDSDKSWNFDAALEVYVKDESRQTAGSFKIRGVVNQFAKLDRSIRQNETTLITMSAGNYGRAFATICKEEALRGFVLLPNSAPPERQQILNNLSVQTEVVPSSELMSKVNQYVQNNGMIFMHSFDDEKLIDGYGSIGLEILEELPDVDVVLVCCGGGGLLAGVASAIRLSGNDSCRIYGVEPQTANTMWQSFQAKFAVKDPSSKSVAAGLAPPFAGDITYKLCQQYVDGILLVSDEEILSATSYLNQNGFRVEPSGAAAFTSLKFRKLPLDEFANKSVIKIVVLLTGGNL